MITCNKQYNYRISKLSFFFFFGGGGGGGGGVGRSGVTELTGI